MLPLVRRRVNEIAKINVTTRSSQVRSAYDVAVGVPLLPFPWAAALLFDIYFECFTVKFIKRTRLDCSDIQCTD